MSRFYFVVSCALAVLALCPGLACQQQEPGADGDPLPGAIKPFPQADTIPPASGQTARVAPPPAGQLYFGALTSNPTQAGTEDNIRAIDIQSFTSTVGSGITWVYVSNNWYVSRAFPTQQAQIIRTAGAIPFIRMMLRSSAEQYVQEPVFTLDSIIAGQFDADLSAWGRAAKAFGTPLLVEWGTECNGEWFQWNGRWNGRDQTTGFGNPQFADGPERFVAAYRHIVRQLRTAGADNARFVWHVVPQDGPNEDWNHLERYYPGTDAVDWMGVSIYGPLSPTNPEPYAPMAVPLDLVYPRLTALDPTKPIIIAELGCSAGNPQVTPDVYARDALSALFANRWPAVIGFTWWNERWQNDDNPQNDTIMRVEELPALAAVFRQQLTANAGKLRVQAVTQTGP